MLKRAWPYPIEFCTRFNIESATALSDISRVISIEHPSVGLDSLAQ